MLAEMKTIFLKINLECARMEPSRRRDKGEFIDESG
jgi:hypothetical protein